MTEEYNQSNSDDNIEVQKQPEIPDSNPQIIRPDNQSASNKPQEPATQPQQIYGNYLGNSEQQIPTKPKKKVLIIFAVILLAIILAVASIFAFNKTRNNNADNSGGVAIVASDCEENVATSMEKAQLINMYKQFVEAVSSESQTCADKLTTEYFRNKSKQNFSAPDGQWITARPLGLRPISEDFSQLPDQLNDSEFKQSEYMQAIIVTADNNQAIFDTNNEVDQSSITGITLSYPVDLSSLTGNSEQEWEISISFVEENNKIRVDDFIIEPQYSTQ